MQFEQALLSRDGPPWGAARMLCTESSKASRFCHRPIRISMTDSLPSGQFSGREAFAKLVRDALECAGREAWPEIILSDATFEEWPLRERAVVESLRVWSAPGRRMFMLASRYDEVVRLHPRFVNWRKTWGHIIDCRVSRSATPGDCPSAIWSQTWYLQRLDQRHSNGVCGNDRERSVALREILDERIRNSSPGFAPSTLGL